MPTSRESRDARLEELFAALSSARSPVAAAPIEQAIWQLWTTGGSEQIDVLMAEGIRAMQAGDARAALHAFDAIVREAPDFAEGWNKRATLYYLVHDYEASLADVERTLTLEPRHFGALSGLALIREAQGRPFEALEALEKVVEIYPQMPGLTERVNALSAQLGDPI